MFTTFQRPFTAGVTALALGASLTVIPTALAEENSATVSLPLDCNVQGNVGSSKGTYHHTSTSWLQGSYPAYQTSVSAQAPSEVEKGSTFQYTLLPSALSFPADLSYGSNRKVNSVSQVNFWLDLPANVELVEDGISIEGENKDAFSVTATGGRLHITGANDAADVTAWAATPSEAWKPGGLATTKNEGSSTFEVKTPTITLTLKATGEAGKKIQPSIKQTTAENFPSDSFYQLYANTGRGAGTPTFVRCSLSSAATNNFPTVTITAPKKKQEVKGAVTLTDPQGNPLAADSQVDLLINGEKETITVGANGVYTLTRQLATGDTEDVTVAFADNPEGAVTVHLTGAQTEPVAATLAQKAYPAQAKIKVTEADGTAVANAEVSVKIGEGEPQTLTTDADGFITISRDLVIGQTEDLTVALAESPETTVAVSLTGAKDAETVTAENALVKKAPAVYSVTAKVKVADAAGKLLAEGTKVSLIVDDAPAKDYTVAADGTVELTAELKDGEEKTFTVAFADNTEQTVTVKFTGKADAQPAVAEETLQQKTEAEAPGDDKKPAPSDDEKPAPGDDKKPENEGSSAVDLSNPAIWKMILDPKIWGPVLATLIGLQALIYVLQTIGDFGRGFLH